MNTPEEIPAMLGEMATVGVSMAILVTTVWFVTTLVADYTVKHNASYGSGSITMTQLLHLHARLSLRYWYAKLRQLHEIWRSCSYVLGCRAYGLVDGMYRLLDGEPFIEIVDAAVMFNDAMLGFPLLS